MARPISAGKRDMILNGNLIRAILTLAIPVMINSFIQSMYNLTDTFWLGKIGTANQAAITLVSPFQNILINFGAGITTAGAILISQYLGGLFGNQIYKGEQLLPLIKDEETLFRVTDAAIGFFEKNANPGERFRLTLQRVGEDEFRKAIKAAYEGK